MTAFPSLSHAMQTLPAPRLARRVRRDSGTPIYGAAPRLNSTGILAAFGSDGWLQSTVGIIADQVSDARWRIAKGVEPGAYKGGPVARKALRKRLVSLPHHELADLLADPGELSARATFPTLAIHSLLLGEAFFFRTDTGGLLPLPPSAVRKIPTQGDPHFHVSYQGLSGIYGPDTVIYLRTGPNPLDPLGRGVGIGHGLSDNVSATEAMEQTIRSTYQRGGAPAGLIGIETREGGVPPDLEDIQKNLDARFSGPANAGKLWAVDGKVSSSAAQANFRDLDAANLAAMMRESLRQILRIPREVMGDSSQSTRAATEAARVHAFDFAVRPILEGLRAEMQGKLAPLYDVSALIEYEVESPSQSDLAVQLATNAVTCSAFGVGEVRNLAGLPRELPRGDRRLDPAPGTKPAEVFLPENP